MVDLIEDSVTSQGGARVPAVKHRRGIRSVTIGSKIVSIAIPKVKRTIIRPRGVG